MISNQYLLNRLDYSLDRSLDKIIALDDELEIVELLNSIYPLYMSLEFVLLNMDHNSDFNQILDVFTPFSNLFLYDKFGHCKNIIELYTDLIANAGNMEILVSLYKSVKSLFDSLIRKVRSIVNPALTVLLTTPCHSYYLPPLLNDELLTYIIEVINFHQILEFDDHYLLMGEFFHDDDIEFFYNKENGYFELY